MYKEYLEKVKLESMSKKKSNMIKQLESELGVDPDLERIMELRQETIASEKVTRLDTADNHNNDNDNIISDSTKSKNEMKHLKALKALKALKQKIMKKPVIPTNYSKPLIHRETKQRKRTIFPPVTNIKFTDDFIKKEFELNKHLIDNVEKISFYNSIKMDNHTINIRNYSKDITRVSKFTK